MIFANDAVAQSRRVSLGAYVYMQMGLALFYYCTRCIHRQDGNGKPNICNSISKIYLSARF